LDGASAPPDITLLMPTLISGGAERVHLNLAEYFVAKGFSVDLVVCKNLGSLRNQVPAGVRLVILDARRVLLSLPRYLEYLRLARPPVVLSSVDNISIVACVGRVLSPHRHSLFVRLDNSLWFGRPVRRQLRRLPWLAAMTSTFPAADGFVAVSEGVRNQLARMPGLRRRPMRVIHNPIIRRDFAAKLAEPVRLSVTSDPDCPFLIAVGRLHWQKDYPTLLRAFASAVRQQPCQLLILGEGPEFAALKASAEALGVAQHVHFVGYVPNPLPYMRRAHAFVLASMQEGFANVVVEALASGTPVICTDCPHGPREILEGGRYGALVPVGDAAALSAAMTRQLRLPKPAPSEDVACHLQRFTLERIGESYIDFLGMHRFDQRGEATTLHGPRGA
jgi:glycosyltransferase involved in cell wall biosynthesis